MASSFADYLNNWHLHGAEAIEDYTDRKTSYVVGLPPQRALELSAAELARILNDRLGEESFRQAIDPEVRVAGHLDDRPNGDWLKSCHTVGINVRTVGSFWNMLKYALTLPDHIRGIHLLPIWEPGVAGSLYGMASWNLNPEFLDHDTLRMFPGLRSVESQLQVTLNLLHALGKVVGVDVMPYADRYSEIVLANPAFFEWLIRDDLTITDHRIHLHETAGAAILDWLETTDPGTRVHRPTFFRETSEAERLNVLFGPPADYDTRRERRADLVDFLYHRGLEPVPVTTAPPYHGLEVDPSPEAQTVDEAGHRRRENLSTRPGAMSRVLGSLARFKFYGRKDDNRDWAIDFDRPRAEVWDYFTDKYAELQARYGFDFMRGKMSQVQMRPQGVPGVIDTFYDPLRAVKHRIARDAPHFAYFADGSLGESGTGSYGDGLEHLTASEAEVTSGNLQRLAPGTSEFLDALTSYLEIAEVTPVTPASTVITGKEDDPRFDHLYHHGEVARLFTGLFNGRLPLYFSLGYEQRDRHFSPAPDAFYTNRYVTLERVGPKSVSGSWRWGDNLELFRGLQSVHRFAEEHAVLLGADAGAVSVGDDGGVSWFKTPPSGDSTYLFLVNFASEARTLQVVMPTGEGAIELLFHWPDNILQPQHELNQETASFTLSSGEVRCYRLRRAHS
ncbi:hypothetical protein [Neolewinella litorea]|uniref:Glycosyl hydrolase family 13 catalytic domain-containing protein n=1 Tax=Neolewinella litorea TaxID=2562452 RepID=A0A4S4NTR4_9BACT|nr:hypothetical protein [Neolewinella litorea]THH41858.1 hypothetical protein E4021_04525 [Neolewinella litorea]